MKHFLPEGLELFVEIVSQTDYVHEDIAAVDAIIPY
jgi:hypothetical protein